MTDETVNTDEPINVGSDIVSDHFEKTVIGKALGIDLNDLSKYTHQIDRLSEWAKLKGAKDPTDIAWSIKQLANRVGSPSIGNNWAQHLSTYAYLEMERMKIDKQLRGMEEPNGNKDSNTT